MRSFMKAHRRDTSNDTISDHDSDGGPVFHSSRKSSGHRVPSNPATSSILGAATPPPLQKVPPTPKLGPPLKLTSTPLSLSSPKSSSTPKLSQPPQFQHSTPPPNHAQSPKRFLTPIRNLFSSGPRPPASPAVRLLPTSNDNAFPSLAQAPSFPPLPGSPYLARHPSPSTLTLNEPSLLSQFPEPVASLSSTSLVCAQDISVLISNTLMKGIPDNSYGPFPGRSPAHSNASVVSNDLETNLSLPFASSSSSHLHVSSTPNRHAPRLNPASSLPTHDGRPPSQRFYKLLAKRKVNFSDPYDLANSISASREYADSDESDELEFSSRFSFIEGRRGGKNTLIKYYKTRKAPLSSAPVEQATQYSDEADISDYDYDNNGYDDDYSMGEDDDVHYNNIFDDSIDKSKQTGTELSGLGIHGRGPITALLASPIMDTDNHDRSAMDLSSPNYDATLAIRDRGALGNPMHEQSPHKNSSPLELHGQSSPDSASTPVIVHNNCSPIHGQKSPNQKSPGSHTLSGHHSTPRSQHTPQSQHSARFDTSPRSHHTPRNCDLAQANTTPRRDLPAHNNTTPRSHSSPHSNTTPRGHHSSHSNASVQSDPSPRSFISRRGDHSAHSNDSFRNDYPVYSNGKFQDQASAHSRTDSRSNTSPRLHQNAQYNQAPQSHAVSQSNSGPRLDPLLPHNMVSIPSSTRQFTYPHDQSGPRYQQSAQQVPNPQNHNGPRHNPMPRQNRRPLDHNGPRPDVMIQQGQSPLNYPGPHYSTPAKHQQNPHQRAAPYGHAARRSDESGRNINNKGSSNVTQSQNGGGASQLQKSDESPRTDHGPQSPDQQRQISARAALEQKPLPALPSEMQLSGRTPDDNLVGQNAMMHTRIRSDPTTENSREDILDSYLDRSRLPSPSVTGTTQTTRIFPRNGTVPVPSSPVPLNPDSAARCVQTTQKTPPRNSNQPRTLVLTGSSTASNGLLVESPAKTSKAGRRTSIESMMDVLALLQTNAHLKIPLNSTSTLDVRARDQSTLTATGPDTRPTKRGFLGLLESSQGRQNPLTIAGDCLSHYSKLSDLDMDSDVIDEVNQLKEDGDLDKSPILRSGLAATTDSRHRIMRAKSELSSKPNQIRTHNKTFTIFRDSRPSPQHLMTSEISPVRTPSLLSVTSLTSVCEDEPDVMTTTKSRPNHVHHKSSIKSGRYF